MRFGFRGKKWYICIAKRRESVSRGFSPLFLLKISVFYLGDRKIYLWEKNFFGPDRIFFGLGRKSQWRFSWFFGRRIIKNIKVFRAKKFDFNSSGNYSGHHCLAMYRTLLATCGSEDFRGLYSLKLLIFCFHFRGATRCKQRAVHCLSMTTWVVTISG